MDMKKYLFFMMGIVLAAGCSSVEGGFTPAELELIRGDRNRAMNVMKSDNPEDLAVLRKTSETVSDEMIGTEDFEVLCDRMLATVQAPENDGVGIAAPQVGISRRLVAVQRFDKEGEPFGFYVNPEIVRYGEVTEPGGEGCLSVPSCRGIVERAQEIDIRYRTDHGTDTLETVCGFTAVIFQHEIDHLDGILYVDKALSVGNEYVETRRLDDGAEITWIQDNAELRMMPRGLFPDASDELMASLGLEDGVPSSVSVFLLEKDGANILFDAGNGLPDSRLHDALDFLDMTVDDIDYVFITHLHGDHIGGLVNDSSAVFPTAQIYLSKDEHDGWMGMDARNEPVMKLCAAYEGKINLFTSGDVLPGGVEAVDAYGHTPGHTVFRYGDYLVAGDIMHGAALQIENPEICAAFDMDKDAAVRSRKRIMDFAAEHGLTVCGMHFPKGWL